MVICLYRLHVDFFVAWNVDKTLQKETVGGMIAQFHTAMNLIQGHAII